MWMAAFRYSLRQQHKTELNETSGLWPVPYGKLKGKSQVCQVMLQKLRLATQAVFDPH